MTLVDVEILCPYCGESFVTTADPSVGSQRYIEDCYVCCRPIECHVDVESDASLQIRVRRDDD